jgi:RNA polymerase sigma factor (sigma-70 family)
MAVQTSLVQRQIQKLQSCAQADSDLLKQFTVAQDEEAFAAIVRRHSSLVLSVCRTVLRNPVDAEDAHQSVFLLLARQAGKIRNPDALAGWLHTTAYRVSSKLRRQSARRSETERNVANRESANGVDLSWREVAAALHEQLSRLPEKYRLPLVLCYLEGRTQDEAARQLGWTPGKLKGMLDRGRCRLRTRLEQRGLTLSAALLTISVDTRSVPAASANAIARVACRLLTTGLTGPSGIGPNGIPRFPQIFYLKPIASLIVAAVLAVGVNVLLAHRPETSTTPTTSSEETPKIAARVDLSGDPLPSGAIARMGTTRFQGDDISRQIAISPDAKQLFVSDWHGVTVFDSITGKKIRRFDMPSDQCVVNSIALSGDGKFLAIGVDGPAGEHPGGIEIRNAESGEILKFCKAANYRGYSSVRFSPDGKAVAACPNTSKRVLMWNTGTGEEIRRWDLDTEAVAAPFFMPDGKTLIAGGLRTIHFWDTKTGRSIRSIVDHPGAVVWQLDLSANGKILASQALKEPPQVSRFHKLDNSIHLWDTTTGAPIRTIKVVGDRDKFQDAAPSIDQDIVCHFHVAPDGKTLATTGGDGVLRIWDIGTGTQLRKWDYTYWGSDFDFSPDGKSLAVLGNGSTILLWDPATGKEIRERPGHRNPIDLMTLSADDRTLATSSRLGDVRLWDTRTGRELRRFAVPERDIAAIHFVEGARILKTTSASRTARCWDTKTGMETDRQQMLVARQIKAQTVSPDRNTIAFVVSDKTGLDNYVVAWDAASEKRLYTLPGGNWCTHVGFSRDGRTILTWCDASTVQMWDAKTGVKATAFRAGDGTAHVCGAFSPDGEWAACDGKDETMLLYHLTTKASGRRIKAPGLADHLPFFLFSPDARTLAVGTRDGIKLFETVTGNVRRRLEGGRVTSMIFSSDNRRLISASEDTTALVWDLTGRIGKPVDRAKPDLTELADRWVDFVSDDAASAYSAMWRLVEGGATATSYIDQQLKPIEVLDDERTKRLISDLDSVKFKVRTEAAEVLEKQGDFAEASLRRALTGKNSPEQRRHLERLIAKIESNRDTPSGELLRRLRAIEVLEQLGSAEAVKVLRRISREFRDTTTRESARASLNRLVGSTKSAP